MTAAERKALDFFAAVGVLGVGARAAGVGAPPAVALPGDGPAAERAALAGQLAAVDSARAARQGRGRGAGKREGDGSTGVGRGAGRKRRVRGADSGVAGAAGPSVGWPAGWPTGTWATPLTPVRGRADTRSRVASAARGAPVAPAEPVDADRADSTAFERLPGVGPALAGRLVADRRARGPFGSMAGLSRVRGVGPALEARLAPLVTFGGRLGPP